jgi:hypothetical protein
MENDEWEEVPKQEEEVFTKKNIFLGLDEGIALGSTTRFTKLTILKLPYSFISFFSRPVLK